MAQYPKTENIVSIGSIVLGILEVKVAPSMSFHVDLGRVIKSHTIDCLYHGRKKGVEEKSKHHARVDSTGKIARIPIDPP